MDENGHIVLKDVRKAFGPKNVLNGINLVRAAKAARWSSSADRAPASR